MNTDKYGIEMEPTKLDAKVDQDQIEFADANQADRDAGMWSEWQNLGIVDTIKTFRFTCLLCMMAAFSAAADGYQIGINGNIVANRGFIEQFGTITSEDGSKALAAPILSAWNSCINVGQIIAMLGFPPLSERFGRKFTLFWLVGVLSISIILECVAKTWQVWLVAKLVAGMGVGTLQFTIPCYIAELAPINARGFLLTMYNFWWSVGGFFASIALQNLNRIQPSNFRIAVYTQWAQIGLMFCIYLFLPETPYWCASRGKHEKGKAVLRRLNGKVPNYDVDAQFDILVQTIEMERETAKAHKRESWTAIFKGVDGFRTLLCAFPLLAQGFLGLGLFYSFSSYFFLTAGLEDPFIGTCVFNSVQLVAIVVVSTLSDGVGRRILFSSGLGLMWITCLIVGALGTTNVEGQGRAAGLVFVTCIWAVGVQMSGSTGFTYLGELPSARHRTRTTGAGFALQNPIGIAIGYGVPYMLSDDYLGWGLKTGFFYAGMGAPFAIGAWFLMPETRKRSAAELDELFEAKVRPWRFHKTETSIERAAKEKGFKTA